MDEERVFTGYCRQLDQTRMVLAEFTAEDGTRRLDGAGCRYPDCRYAAECTVAQDIRETLK